MAKRKRNLTEHQRFRLRDLALQPADRASLFAEGAISSNSGDMNRRPGLASSSMSGAVRSCARIEPMKKIARSYARTDRSPANYFHAKKQFSSGIVEGPQQ